MLLLKGKEKSELLKEKHKDLVKQYFWDEKKYVAVLFFWESNPSQVYVKLKAKYANEIWLDFVVFWQKEYEINENYSDLKDFQDKKYEDKDSVIELVKFLNKDERCVGIICQLPLTPELKPYEQEICDEITPLKDMDWLWKYLQNWAFEWKIDFLPATAQAVISLWKSYDLWDFEWKIISVIWKSKIVWFPIAKYLQFHWAKVQSFDVSNIEEEIIEKCQNSDVIIACTWNLHMIDERFLKDDKSQILIDVWYWFIDGKATWDVDFERVESKVFAISPVPGGVWPMTVASLFDNIFTILSQKEKIQNLEKDL